MKNLSSSPCIRSKNSEKSKMHQHRDNQLSQSDLPTICCSPNENSDRLKCQMTTAVETKGHYYSSNSSSSSSSSPSNFHLDFNMMSHLFTVILIVLCLVCTPGMANRTRSFGDSSILANHSTTTMSTTGHHHRANLNNHNHGGLSSHNHHRNNNNGSEGHGHGHGRGHGGQHHRCYVCLPPDPREAADIKAIFPNETQHLIPDCSSFNWHNYREYAFRCPENYAGCLIRTHGDNTTRSCAKFGLTDCKIANQVELCYCTGNLCNYKKPELNDEEIQSHQPQPMDEDSDVDSEEKAKTRLTEEKDEAEARKFQEGDTDDEDLLQPHNEQPWEGSGCDGILCSETTTPPTTLIPNLRTIPTTSPPVGGSDSILPSYSLPILSILFTVAYHHHHHMVNHIQVNHGHNQR